MNRIGNIKGDTSELKWFEGLLLLIIIIGFIIFSSVHAQVSFSTLLDEPVGMVESIDNLE